MESAINENSLEENLPSANHFKEGNEDANRASIIDNIQESPIKPSEDQSQEDQSNINDEVA